MTTRRERYEVQELRPNVVGFGYVWYTHSATTSEAEALTLAANLRRAGTHARAVRYGADGAIVLD